MMRTRSWIQWIPLLLGALVLAGAAWLLWEPLAPLLSDLDALRAWVAGLGPWGPVAIIALGVVQVVVAPLPGYPVVLVSGLLFGGVWGAIYANLGILLAGLAASTLARAYGRPLVERFVAQTHLTRVERLLASDSPWLWFFVLLLPTGDLPYFAAGLSRLSRRNFCLALIAARWPFTFLLTHAAAQATTLPREMVVGIVAGVALLGLLGYWQQARIGEWAHRLLDRLPHPSQPEA